MPAPLKANGRHADVALPARRAICHCRYGPVVYHHAHAPDDFWLASMLSHRLLAKCRERSSPKTLCFPPAAGRRHTFRLP